jgi:NAD+--asparagine ADP-ribosyltransferase
VSTSQKGLSGQKRKVDDDKLANTSKKATKPFYVSKANFLSLLNIGKMIEQSGSLRHCWEGQNESYIQNVKREISTMKHNENYLKTILIKILKTEILDYFNKDNPFSKAKNIPGPVM